MYKIIIRDVDKFFINDKPFVGEFFIEPGNSSLLTGDNGVGKSTFFHFLKLKQDQFLPKLKCNFMDQLRLVPINDISFKHLIRSLEAIRFEKLTFFEENIHLVQNYINTPINSLSGGQNQMIKIFLSAYIGGDIFFFDEPLQFLDKRNKVFFNSYVKYLKEQNKAICLIEHNTTEIMKSVNHQFSLEYYEDRINIGVRDGL